MKACPLTFNHPSEAQQLDGIGPNICSRLTRKLEEHCEANGLPVPTKGKRKRRSGIEDVDAALDDDESPAPAKKPRKKKPYVPGLRSGPYALVLALSSLPEDSLQSLSKAELQVLAQPHCDSSFTVPSEANKFYTAWSSMKTLVEKDLVQEKGRPTRKYNLSDEGWEVARRIRAVESKRAMAAADKDVSQEKNQAPKKASADAEPVSRGFLDLDEDSEWESMTAVPSKAQRTFTETSGTSVTGTRLGEHAVGVRSAFQRFPTPSAQEQAPRLDAGSGFVDLLSSPEPIAPDPPRLTVSQNTQANSQVAVKPYSSKFTSKEISSANADNLPQQDRSTSLSSKGSDLPPFQDISFPPGSFTVQLVLDNREVRTKDDRDYLQDELTKKGIKPILRALELGDFFWVAKLNDPSTLSNHGESLSENSSELALDWIVERKRLDDLVGSIKDGRFNEQKFRLKKSGVKNVIYLIEEFTLGNEKESMHEAIQSAIASTQVVNGFFVKKTQKLDETIRYIARLTRMLKDLYETRPLHLIPSRIIDGENYLPLLQKLRNHRAHRDRSYHPTYPTFASLVSKTDNLTLRDIYIRMLMCLRGLTADKALAMQRIWSTPKALIEAFEACGTDSQRQSLVSDKMAGAVGRAQVKRGLSEKVAGVWG